MHQDLVLLAEVDRTDRVIDRIRKDKAAADASVVDARAAVKAAHAELERLTAELEATEKEQRENQRTLEKYEARKQSAERVLEGGGGDPEAAQRQLESVTQILDDLETRLLEGMERTETLTESIQAASGEVEAAKQALTAAEEQHPQTITALKAEYATVTGEREAAYSELDRSLQSKYDAVRQRKGHAVTRIENDSCRSCHRAVGAQHVTDLQRGLVIPCRGCGRWLIPPPPAT